MNIIDIKEEFKNSKLLLIVLGTLFISVINSVDSLLAGLFKVLGLTIKNLLILSISFHGLIIVCLVCILFWTLSFSNDKEGGTKILLSRRTLKNFGLITFLIVIVGAVVNMYIKKNYGETVDSSQVDSDLTDLAYLSMTHTGLMIFRNLFLFAIYLIIALRGK
jgi:hypothetical protein